MLLIAEVNGLTIEWDIQFCFIFWQIKSTKPLSKDLLVVSQQNFRNSNFVNVHSFSHAGNESN